VSLNFEHFGKYILLEKIQTGGMAEIYLARRPGASGVSKFLAIKRILPQFSEQKEFIEMFKDEAKIAVNLSHANIVSIHEFGTEQNQFYLAMDYVEGRNLRQILNKMKKSGVMFSIEQVLYIVKEVAGGLDHAHRCIDANTGKPLNIIHRDMSPQNVMVSFEGEVKVVDFGIAKAETQLDTTRAGTLKGKFGYMSPEQAEGQAVDLRTDIFALGIVLWELLANDRLFVANNEINTLRKVRDCQIPSLRKINPNIPQELERIVSKALAKDRNLRYQTAAAFHRELSRFLNRQYPDFSPHDFSVFIKTLFAAEILDSRKKMVEFAKAELALPRAESPGMPPSVSEFNDRGNFTNTPTMTEHTTHPDEPAPPFERAAKNAGASPRQPKSGMPKQEPAIDRGRGAAGIRRHPAAAPQLSANERVDTTNLTVDRSAFRDREGYTSTGGTNYGTRTGSQISYKRKRFSVAAVLPFFLIFIGLAAGILAMVPNPHLYVQKIAKFAGIDPTKITNLSSSDQEIPEPPPTPPPAFTYKVEIKSNPSGAEILLDSKQLAELTPAQFSVPRNTEHRIALRKNGFVPFEQNIMVDRNLSFEVKLLQERMGKLDVVVRGAGEIYINDKKVSDGSPLLGFPVKADQDIVVRAFDPATKAVDEVKVRVQENTLKKVTLFPHAPARRQDGSVQ